MNGNAKWIIIIVALLIGVFIGYFAERQRAIFNMENAKLSWQKQIDDAKITNQKLVEENTQLKITPSPTPKVGAKKVTPTPTVGIKKTTLTPTEEKE